MTIEKTNRFNQLIQEGMSTNLASVHVMLDFDKHTDTFERMKLISQKMLELHQSLGELLDAHDELVEIAEDEARDKIAEGYVIEGTAIE